MSVAATDRRCLPEDVGVEFTDDAPEELRAAIASYLAQFDAPIKNATASHLLCSCGAGLTGILGSFCWGLVHGEGYCVNCRRPARAYHSIRDAEGEVVRFSTVLLWAATASEETR